jgi:hypothetical protein
VKGIFHKTSVFCFSYIFLFSVVLGHVTYKPAEKSFSDALDHVTEEPVEKSVSEPNFLSNLFKENLDRIKNLNYYTSKDLTLKLPNNQELYIDWGFTGSGDVLSPFSEIKTEFRSSEGSDKKQIDSDVDKGSAYSALLKLFLKSKLKSALKAKLIDYAHDISALDWILSVEQNAFSPFILKLLLLGKQPFEQGQEVKRNIELLRLFLRLVQSGAFKLTNTKKTLFSYLPKEVADFVEQNISPDFKKFIDEMWAIFGKKFKEYNFDPSGAYDIEQLGAYATGFVFHDAKDVADECLKKLNLIKKAKPENFTSSLFEEEVEKLKPSSYEVVEMDNFEEVKRLKNYRFIGHNSFGRVTKDSVSGISLPEKVKSEILSGSNNTAQGPQILKVEVSDKETWLIYVSPKLTFLDTLKLSFISILQGYEEFKKLRAQDLALADSEELKKAKLSEEEIEELKNLYVQKNTAKEALSFSESKTKKELLVLQNKKDSVGKDKLSQDLVRIEQKNYDKMVAGSKELREKLDNIIKRIGELEQKANDVLLNFAQDDKTIGKNIAKLFTQVFVSSPEFKSMFDAFNGSDEKYAIVRKNLIKRLTNIFKNSENFTENLEIYKFIILYMFPEFRNQFDELVASQNLKENKIGIFDSVLASLGL